MRARSSKPQVLWRIDTADGTWTCELLMLASGQGWIVEVLKGRHKFTGSRLTVREEAIQWADEMRRLFLETSTRIGIENAERCL